MPATYRGGGLQFQYPENWTIEPGEGAEGWSVAVQSPGTAFVLLSVHEDRPAVADVLATTLAALREDYPDLETDEAEERIAGRIARGLDVRFFSLDLSNTCRIRCFRTRSATVLLMSQANDLEWEAAEPVLRAIQASLELDEVER